MSQFEVHEVKTREQMHAAINVVWEGMATPFRPEIPWMHPIFGYTEADRLASIEKDTDRRWKNLCDSDTDHWFSVSDTSSGQVVGAVHWQIYEKNPFPNGPIKLECDWMPEGETRDFVTYVINQCYYARMNWMNRPHISFASMAVLPNMRGRGIGSLLMQYGMQKASELDLECFVEASELGSDLYQSFDFQPLMTFLANTYKKHPSLAWIRLHNMYSPVTSILMWRPAPSELRSDKKRSFWDTFRAAGR